MKEANGNFFQKVLEASNHTFACFQDFKRPNLLFPVKTSKKIHWSLTTSLAKMTVIVTMMTKRKGMLILLAKISSMPLLLNKSLKIVSCLHTMLHTSSLYAYSAAHHFLEDHPQNFRLDFCTANSLPKFQFIPAFLLTKKVGNRKN